MPWDAPLPPYIGKRRWRDVPSTLVSGDWTSGGAQIFLTYRFLKKNKQVHFGSFGMLWLFM